MRLYGLLCICYSLSFLQRAQGSVHYFFPSLSSQPVMWGVPEGWSAPGVIFSGDATHLLGASWVHPACLPDSSFPLPRPLCDLGFAWGVWVVKVNFQVI